MKEIVVTGGKGGCGKTTVAASLAFLADGWVTVDCDVDSPNLGILAQPIISERTAFTANQFEIDPDKCSRCGLCIEKCAFDAISEDFVIDQLLCESCGFCKVICPEKAISEGKTDIGHWKIGDSRFGPFLDAYLQPGAENSGKLVALLREKAKERARAENADGIIIDGPPGIGCPVIASITGADLAVAVAEPTISGVHDVKRIVELTSTLKTRVGLIINKSDISAKNETELKQFAFDNEIALLGALPYESKANEAQSAMKTLVEYSPDCAFSIEMRKAWGKITALIGGSR